MECEKVVMSGIMGVGSEVELGVRLGLGLEGVVMGDDVWAMCVLGCVCCC